MRLNYIDNIDCLEGLKEIPDKSVDLIVTDPPYFLSMGHAGSKTNAQAGKSDALTSNRTFNDLAICTPFYKQLFAEYARVLKDDGSFYFFTDWRGYAYYFPLINAELPVRNMIVWDKKSGPGSFYSFAHELMVVYLTTQPKEDTPTHVTIEATGRTSTAICEHIDAVSVTLVDNWIGTCSEEEMNAIDAAMLAALGIEVEEEVELTIDAVALAKITTERDTYKRIVDKMLLRGVAEV